MHASRARVLLIVPMLSVLAAGYARAEFVDDFSQGLRSTLWTVTQTIPGLYSVDDTQGDLRLATAKTPPGNFQNITVSLNLASVIGASSIAGDFSASLRFSDAALSGSGVNQAELHAHFADGSLLYNVRSNENGQNVHVWINDGRFHGYTPVSSSSGVFTISRIGSTLSAYLNGGLLFSEMKTAALTDLSFVLQNYSGSNPISIHYDEFSLAATRIVPEPASLVLSALGCAGLACVGRLRPRRPRHATRGDDHPA